MIKKESFVRLIQAVTDQNEKERELCKVLEPFFDGHFVSMVSSKLVDTLISSLEDDFDDVFSTISWWFYDCDCGRHELEIIMEDGEKLVLKTSEDLYDCLVKRLIENENRHI